jgi:hypothetical protein
LEVTVALVIAALSLGLMVRAAATGIRAARLAGMYEEAMSRAQSRLDAVAAPGVTLRPRVERGEEDGGFRWTVDVRADATGVVARQHFAAASDASPRLTLFVVRVTEAWANGTGIGQVTLAARRLGAPP